MARYCAAPDVQRADQVIAGLYFFSVPATMRGSRGDCWTRLQRRLASLDDFPQFNSRVKTMVKIRLSRGGAKGRPFYHIVVADERKARDGRNIERVGFYNPIASGKDVRLQLDAERVKAWVAKGAQLTDKVRWLMKEAGKQAKAA